MIASAESSQGGYMGRGEQMSGYPGDACIYHKKTEEERPASVSLCTHLTVGAARHVLPEISGVF